MAVTQPTPAELAAAGKALMANWLTTYDSNDPVHNLAVVEVDRAFKLGDFLDLQKNYVKVGTDKIKIYISLSESIIDLNPSGDTDAKRKLGQLPKEEVGSAAKPGKDDAAVLARANDLIDRLHAAGLALDVRPADASGKEIPYKSVDDLEQVTPDTYTDWTNKLKNKTDYINTTATQDQINLQTILTQFNRAFEVASTALKKNSDLWLAIIHNLKIS